MSRMADPRFRELHGIAAAVGSAGIDPMPSAKPGARSTPLTGLFPTHELPPAFFQQIPVPAGLQIPEGQQAWYGLLRLRVDEDTGQEVTISGAEITMSPCDWNGVGGAGASDPIAWGDSQGLSAAIVVGRNLPCDEGEWCAAVAHIGGIEYGNANPPAHTLRGGRHAAQYTVCETFPAGTWLASNPSKRTIVRNRAPYVVRFAQGSTLDVALVVRRATVHNLASPGTIVGSADVRLIMGNTRADGDFTQ